MGGIAGFFSGIKKYVVAHKVISTIAVLAILGAGYWVHAKVTNTSGQTRYVLATAQMQTIISTVSGSGQVSPTDQVDIKPKASGDVVSVLIQNGKRVSAGTVIAYLDSTDARHTVQNAQVDLQNAQLALAKLQKPADELSLTQAQNTLSQANESVQSDYTSSYNDVANAFLDLPSIMTGLNNVDLGTVASHGTQGDLDYYAGQAALYESSPQAQTYRDNAFNAYTKAKTSYDTTFADYQSSSRTSDATTTAILLQETYGTTRLIANAVKLANALIQYYQDQFSGHNLSPIAQSNTDLSSLNTFTGKVNTHLSNLLNDVNSLQKDRDAVTTDALSLQKLQAGSDPFDIQSAQLSIEQKQNALQQAQDALANYTIRAPFDGTIANLTIHKGDNVGSTAVGTEITAQDIADLSLNEVDAAKIKTGQKATLTFDAIDGLSLTGIVADVSPLGTVSQGVVSYDVKIAFDAQDPRVKAGMTVNAAIQTGIVQNALSVPSSAIHVQGNSSYVLAFDALPAGADTAGTSAQGGSSSGGQGVVSSIPPRQLPVTTGISDDANTEITSGLQVGQTVVARTITGTTQATAASAPSLFGGGGRGLGGGTVRTSGSGGARGN